MASRSGRKRACASLGILGEEVRLLQTNGLRDQVQRDAVRPEWQAEGERTKRRTHHGIVTIYPQSTATLQHDMSVTSTALPARLDGRVNGLASLLSLTLLVVSHPCGARLELIVVGLLVVYVGAVGCVRRKASEPVTEESRHGNLNEQQPDAGENLRVGKRLAKNVPTLQGVHGASAETTTGSGIVQLKTEASQVA